MSERSRIAAEAERKRKLKEEEEKRKKQKTAGQEAEEASATLIAEHEKNTTPQQKQRDKARTTTSDAKTKEKLFKAAEGQKDTKGLEARLYAMAAAEMLDEEQQVEVVKYVLDRLQNTETGVQGGKLGVPHNPTNQLATLLQGLRF